MAASSPARSSGLTQLTCSSGAALAHVFNQAVRPAVYVINGDNMAVFIQQLEHRGDGRQTGGKSVAARAAFQFGNRRFQRMAGRVAAAGVLVAGMLPGRGLRKRRGGVNWRHNGAVLVVKFAAVNAEGGQIFHH